MAKNSPIEWTGDTWPIVNGCRRVSPGCVHCYAERLIATRLRQMPKYKGLAIYDERGPHWTGESRLWVPDLDIPLRTKKPTTFFVANMGDLFWEKVTDEEIAAVFGVMAACPQHVFQVLTKRADRMRQWFEWLKMAAKDHGYARIAYCLRALSEKDGTGIPYVTEEIRQRIVADEWPLPNVHLGVSAEDQKYADARIPHLLATPAAVRFVSYEPALGPVDFIRSDRMLLPFLFRSRPDFGSTPMGGSAFEHRAQDEWDERFRGVGWERGIDWVIVGGESGPGARWFELGWARLVIDQCKAAGVACFVKQMGSSPCDALVPIHLKDRKGGDMEEWPGDLRVREFPRGAR